MNEGIKTVESAEDVRAYRMLWAMKLAETNLKASAILPLDRRLSSETIEQNAKRAAQDLTPRRGSLLYWRRGQALAFLDTCDPVEGQPALSDVFVVPEARAEHIDVMLFRTFVSLNHEAPAIVIVGVDRDEVNLLKAEGAILEREDGVLQATGKFRFAKAERAVDGRPRLISCQTIPNPVRGEPR